MPSESEVKEYLGIDFDDEATDNNIKLYIDVAKEYLTGAIDNFNENDTRAKQLALFIIEDLYERNTYKVKENSTLQKLKHSLMFQLQCEGLEKNG